MGASTYIQNSPSSTNGIDIESTAFGCTGVVNGVLTVCQYFTNLPAGSWSGPWDTESGVHIQTDPDTNPDGSWDMASGYFQCYVNSQTNVITYNAVPPPSAAEIAKLAAPKVPETKANYRQRRRGCSQK